MSVYEPVETGFHVCSTIGGARKLLDPLGHPVATFGDNGTEQGARDIAQALNDAAEWPARAARAVAYIEQHIAALPCDEVPDELVCALMALSPCVEVPR